MAKIVEREPHNMEYNSEKNSLVFPEYGRNIQEMVLFAKREPDLTKRQLMIESIVTLMYQMNPQSKNVDDYKEKLWKHVFRIADYNLGGVLPPSGIHPVPEDIIKRPEPIDYPPSGARFRHYGNNIHLLIRKAQNMEDGVVREGLVGTIGAYMKLAYRTWNKEHYVSDDIIKGDLETLSNGQLELEDGQRIDKLAAANKRRKEENKNTNSDYRDRNDRNDRDRNDRDGRNNDRKNNGGYSSRPSNNNYRNDGRDNRDNRDNRGGDRDNRMGMGGRDNRDNRGDNRMGGRDNRDNRGDNRMGGRDNRDNNRNNNNNNRGKR